MPYLKPEDRKRILVLENIFPDPEKLIRINAIDCAGDLQYAIAEMVHSYLQRHGLNYQHCNDMLGAMSGAYAEFYRVVVAPYEQEKISENGRVYYGISGYPKPGKY